MQLIFSRLQIQMCVYTYTGVGAGASTGTRTVGASTGTRTATAAAESGWCTGVGAGASTGPRTVGASTGTRTATATADSGWFVRCVLYVVILGYSLVWLCGIYSVFFVFNCRRGCNYYLRSHKQIHTCVHRNWLRFMHRLRQKLAWSRVFISFLIFIRLRGGGGARRK